VSLTSYELSGRDRAILRAVATGRAELVCGREPALFLEGRCCCDQGAARGLAHAGLIAPAVPGVVGQRVPAAVTDAGAALLAAASLHGRGRCDDA